MANNTEKTQKTKEPQMVKASIGFNVTDADGSERRYEANKPFAITEITAAQITALKDCGVELHPAAQRKTRTK